MSHHKTVEATVRITNDGQIISVWFDNPYTGDIVMFEGTDAK